MADDSAEQAAIDIIYWLEHNEIGVRVSEDAMRFIRDRIRELVKEG